jgi:hypothetical protein
MTSVPNSKLARLKAELDRAHQAADRDWQRRTAGVPDRFLPQLRADHEAKWASVLDILRQEIAKLSSSAPR